jgi:hypothetical protein
MAIDPQNVAQIRDRELRVWDQLLRGLEGVEIARREGVDPAVISRIKKRVERRIISETDGKAEGLKARQIGEIVRSAAHVGHAHPAGPKPRCQRAEPERRSDSGI